MGGEETEAAAAATSYKAHILVLAFHGQGHMNPMIQFSKRLASKGIKITLASVLSAIQTMPPQSGSISFQPVYDDLGQGGYAGPAGFMGFMERFESVGSKNLKDLIEKHGGSDNPIKWIVYDANLPWVLQVAKGAGIVGAAFFTQSCAAVAAYLDMLKGDETQPLPELGLSNLNMGSGPGRFPPILNLIMTQFSNLDGADLVLFNSFDKLEEEVVKDLLKLYPVMAIGPTIPSMYLDKRIETDRDYGFNLYQSTGDTCINWLDTKQKGSVIYISFGSAAGLGAQQMEEVACGVKESNLFFLWVIRASEMDKLPKTFRDETSEKGLIVTWCPQLDVLSHSAVGCFVTHCGWNSTVEGVSLGVPMIAMPQFLDQFSDAKFVEEVWEVGVRSKLGEQGFVTRNEIERCIKDVMEGDRGETIKRNASKWKDLAKEAVDEGGSSDRNIQEIVARLL